MDRRVEACLHARVVQQFGGLPLFSFASVSVHVVLPVSRNAVVDPHSLVPATFKHPESHRVSHEFPLGLQPHEDVCVRYAR